MKTVFIPLFASSFSGGIIDVHGRTENSFAITFPEICYVYVFECSHAFLEFKFEIFLLKGKKKISCPFFQTINDVYLTKPISIAIARGEVKESNTS
jgi:hypothetical protein